MDFTELNVPISKDEYENRRPEGYRTEINRPHWVARFKQVCDLVQKHWGGRKRSEERILEVGAFRYNLTTILSLKGYEIVGIDKDPTQMAQYIDKEGLDIRKCDIEREDLPFPDDEFSTVLFTEVFEHLRINPFHTLRELHRITKSGGTLIMSTPNIHYIMNIVSLIRRNGIHNLYDGYDEWKKLDRLGYPGHVRIYSADELEKFLVNTGFTTEEILYNGYPRNRKAQILHPLCKFVPWMRQRITIVASG